MISIVIPTRNRGYTLEKVLPSYYDQAGVSEIVFVDDAGSDETKQLVDSFAQRYGQIKTVYFRFAKRQGSPVCRNKGVELASSDVVVFGEDDVFLGERYAQKVKERLESDVAVVSGRLVLLGEERDEEGFPFNFSRFGYCPEKRIEREVAVPLTHALIGAKREDLLEDPFDEFFRHGNSFREESTFQAKMGRRGKRVVVIPDIVCMHLHPSEVKSGGQRISPVKRLWWNLYYGYHFYKRYGDTFTGEWNHSYLKFVKEQVKEWGKALKLAVKKRMKRCIGK